MAFPVGDAAGLAGAAEGFEEEVGFLLAVEVEDLLAAGPGGEVGAGEGGVGEDEADGFSVQAGVGGFALDPVGREGGGGEDEAEMVGGLDGAERLGSRQRSWIGGRAGGQGVGAEKSLQALGVGAAVTTAVRDKDAGRTRFH